MRGFLRVKVGLQRRHLRLGENQLPGQDAPPHETSQTSERGENRQHHAQTHGRRGLPFAVAQQVQMEFRRVHALSSIAARAAPSAARNACDFDGFSAASSASFAGKDSPSNTDGETSGMRSASSDIWLQ